MSESEQADVKSEKKWTILKKFGFGTILFFVIKGTISTILILYTGKGIWVWLTKLLE